MRHNLKTDPAIFDEVAAGRMTCQIRNNDRGFAVGDTLILQKTAGTGAEMAKGKPLVYTGELAFARITHILPGPIYGIAEGWVMLSICTI